MADVQSPISRETGRGATILTSYTERQVKAYPIFESELESLSFLNTMTLVFFSVASAMVSFAVGIWTNAAFAEKLTAEGVVASTYGASVLLVGALICYGLGGLALYSRRQQWSKIKTESIARTETLPDDPVAVRRRRLS